MISFKSSKICWPPAAKAWRTTILSSLGSIRRGLVYNYLIEPYKLAVSAEAWREFVLSSQGLVHNYLIEPWQYPPRLRCIDMEGKESRVSYSGMPTRL